MNMSLYHHVIILFPVKNIINFLPVKNYKSLTKIIIFLSCLFPQEIDYTKEAANAELFASNFKDMDYVKVPAIYWEYTTPQV